MADDLYSEYGSAFDDDNILIADDSYLKEAWTPQTLPERAEERSQLESCLRMVLRNSSAENAFLLGQPGLGKTALCDSLLCTLESKADERGVNLETLKISVKDNPTSYQVALAIANKLGMDAKHGRPNGQVMEKMYTGLDNAGCSVVIVLDEVHRLGNDHDILDAIARAKSKGVVDESVHPSIIGTSNDLGWPSSIDSEVRDALKAETITFDPYDSNQLRSILKRRAVQALVDTEPVRDEDGNIVRNGTEIELETDVLTVEPIPLASAYAAQENGSARKTLQYFRKAVRLAEDDDADVVDKEYAERAREKIEEEAVRRGIRQLPQQQKAVLTSVYLQQQGNNNTPTTSEVYDTYCGLTDDLEMDQYTQRAVYERLQELDQHLIEIERGKKHRYTISTDPDIVASELSDDSRWTMQFDQSDITSF